MGCETGAVAPAALLRARAENEADIRGRRSDKATGGIRQKLARNGTGERRGGKRFARWRLPASAAIVIFA